MTDKLAEWRKITEAATPGGVRFMVESDNPADAQLVTLAWHAMPQLLAIAEALAKWVDQDVKKEKMEGICIGCQYLGPCYCRETLDVLECARR